MQFNDARAAARQKVEPFIIKLFSKFNEPRAVTSPHICDITSLPGLGLVCVVPDLKYEKTLEMSEHIALHVFFGTGCACASYLCSLCNCIHIKFTDTPNIHENFLLASL